jgi:hypothetical protein
MYYVVNVDHKEWQFISPQVIMKGFEKCCISNVVDGTDTGLLWNDGQKEGMLRVSVRKMKTVTVNMEKVALFGKCR